MSYIIAFVKFTDLGAAYPVECLRTDIAVGDDVLIQLPKRPLTRAVVTELAYLNWNCSGRIRSKVVEASRESDGVWHVNSAPSTVGLATAEALAIELKSLGWINLKPKQIYRVALSYSNSTQSANILLRKNGVDFQILTRREDSNLRPYKQAQESFHDGLTVMHYLAHTNFNLYEGALRFARSFMNNEGTYDRYFKSVGESDKRTARLKLESEARKRNLEYERSQGLGDYYDMMSDGSGEGVYLSDGMWLGPGGRLYDDGR